MIASASILPLVENMTWGRARAPRSSALTVVDFHQPIDVESYRRRDEELAYRDLVIGALLTQTAIRAGDVWQFAASRPQLPASVAPDLSNISLDLPVGGITPSGPVDHVVPSSRPFEAASTDQELYARDLILYRALAAVAQVFSEQDNPLSNLSALTEELSSLPPSDAWSLADGLAQRMASVGFGLPLNVSLFKTPDRDLAARDNQLATFIAQLQFAVSDLFARATRLYVRAPGCEPETYVLSADTADIRVWSAFPRLDGRLQVVYRKAFKTLSWLGEQPAASGPQPTPTTEDSLLTVPVAGGDLTVIGEIPRSADAEFFRQKSGRLVTRTSRDTVIFNTQDPELFLTSGGLYQPSAVLLPINCTAAFALPIVIPPGCVRIGFHVQPTRVIPVLGYLNRTRAATGTAVTLEPDEPVVFDIPLPPTRLFFQLDITDLTAATTSFAIEITADWPHLSDARSRTVVFDGAFTFNQRAGASVLTQFLSFDNTPFTGATPAILSAPVELSVRWKGGPGQFTLNGINFITSAPENAGIVYTLAAQLGPNQPTTAVQLLGLPERADVVWFDTLAPDTFINPVLGLSFQGGGTIALLVHGYDLRVFDVQSLLPNPSAYEPHKMRLAKNALHSVQGAYAKAIADEQVSALTSETNAWASADYLSWIADIKHNGEDRMESAFAVAGPGDIGRPALVPSSLRFDLLPVCDRSVLGLRPEYRLLQPWMLAFNPRVAGADFWPQSDQGCASLGSLTSVAVQAAFDWSQSDDPSARGFIVQLSALSHVTGAPDGREFTAWTITNNGPIGGVVQQTVTLTVEMANLNTGAIYSLTIQTLRELISTGAQTPFTIVIPITATGSTMVEELPPIVAPTGYKVLIQSVVMS